MVWLTCMDGAALPAVNALWLYLEQNQGSLITECEIIHPADNEEAYALFVQWCNAIFAAFGKKIPSCKSVTFPKNELTEFRRLIKKRLRSNAGKSVLDISASTTPTGGICLLMADLFPGKVQACYYACLKNAEYAGLPLSAIPAVTIDLHNLLGGGNA